MLAIIRHAVADLEALHKRAEKYRTKSGTVRLAADDLNRLQRLAGGQPFTTGEHKISIADYVELLDAAIAATEKRFMEALDGLCEVAHVSEET